MTETGLERIDGEALTKKLAALLQDKFAELVPDEAWESMVAKEIKAFFEPVKGQYSSDDKPSAFTKIVQEELKGKIKADVEGFLRDQNVFASVAHGQEPSDFVKEVAVKVAPAAFQRMIEATVQNMVSSMSLGQSGY